MKYLSYDNINIFYLVENTNTYNCHKNSYQDYYINDKNEVLKKFTNNF